ncbi:MAG: response regulator [Deltaproteobacteria bacterium]|nr:response regulator [Deltaproteobacteria bacterium]
MPALKRETGPSVLVVDDDPNELRALVIGLRLEGFDAAGAPDGSTAQRMLAEKTYAAAIIDLMMPEINGLQLARALRTSFPAVITILMSAYHLSPKQLSRADTGAMGFVPKPFRFDELVRFIRSKIDPRAASDAPFESRRGTRTRNGEPDFFPPFEIPSKRSSQIPALVQNGATTK